MKCPKCGQESPIEYSTGLMMHDHTACLTRQLAAMSAECAKYEKLMQNLVVEKFIRCDCFSECCCGYRKAIGYVRAMAKKYRKKGAI